MRTKIFIYKGVIGIQSGPDAEYLLSKPEEVVENGITGCALESKGVDISPEALDALKRIPKASEGFGEFEIFQAKDKIIVGWVGGYIKAFWPDKIILPGPHYNPSLLTAIDGVEIPIKFMEMVDDVIVLNHN